MVPGRRAKSQIEAGSRRPPDAKHPFGYGRIEYFSAIAIAALVLAAGAGSLVESVKKIVRPETPEYGAAALVIVAVAVVAKFLLGRYVSAQGKACNSEALADLGYRPEQVSKILITHKHADHTGMLGAFPNAEIICSAAEAEADEIKPFHPTVATFQDGPYFEFPASQKIADGVTYIPARGHTTGNCLVVVESDGLFYLIHGDVTYTDVALYENKLSVVFEDQAAARETLDRVRAFCAARPTVYLGTHTPEALKSLAAHRVVDLANPPAVIPSGEIVFKTATGKYVCSVCGYVYDPAEHDGVAFENLPADWRCPRCKQSKDKFNPA